MIHIIADTQLYAARLRKELGLTNSTDVRTYSTDRQLRGVSIRKSDRVVIDLSPTKMLKLAPVLLGCLVTCISAPFNQ
jgi:hypothetical protein